MNKKLTIDEVKARIKEIQKMKKKHKSWRIIAEKLNMSPKSIHKYRDIKTFYKYQKYMKDFKSRNNIAKAEGV